MSMRSNDMRAQSGLHKDFTLADSRDRNPNRRNEIAQDQHEVGKGMVTLKKAEQTERAAMRNPDLNDSRYVVSTQPKPASSPTTAQRPAGSSLGITYNGKPQAKVNGKWQDAPSQAPAKPAQLAASTKPTTSSSSSTTGGATASTQPSYRSSGALGEYEKRMEQHRDRWASQDATAKEPMKAVRGEAAIRAEHRQKRDAWAKGKSDVDPAYTNEQIAAGVGRTEREEKRKSARKGAQEAGMKIPYGTTWNYGQGEAYMRRKYDAKMKKELLDPNDPEYAQKLLAQSEKTRKSANALISEWETTKKTKNGKFAMGMEPAKK